VLPDAGASGGAAAGGGVAVMVVLAVGDAFDGVQLYGPFGTREEAIEWAGDVVAWIGVDWHAVEVRGLQEVSRDGRR
jgi:hypothetical protein